MITRRLVIAVACAGAVACGDNLQRSDDLFTPVSGARLALQRYRYDDGTELAVAGEFYDTLVHARCTPRAWIDGAVRCVPVGDDAEYTDPGCTALVGLGRTVATPTHFLVYAAPPAGGAVARVFRAGAAAPPITQYYALDGGACVGPIPVAPTLTRVFALADEVDGAALVAFHDHELGEARLGLVVRDTDDGLRVWSAMRDRELDVACTPAVQPDASVACAPGAAAAASYYGDAACRDPVVAAAGSTVASLVEPSGCTTYHAVGAEVRPPVYRRDGGACAPVDVPADTRLSAVDRAIELPVLGRSLELAAGRRLQRIVLDLGGLRVLDDRLFDTAIGADCTPRSMRGSFRCIPANVTTTTSVFAAGCTTPILVAEVASPACERPAYAIVARPFQIRAIGEVVPDVVFRLDGDTCVPYSGSPGTELRALGPPIDPTMFVSGIYFGERAL